MNTLLGTQQVHSLYLSRGEAVVSLRKHILLVGESEENNVKEEKSKL